MHKDGVGRIDDEGLLSEPVDELITVACFKNLPDRVLAVHAPGTGGNRQKVQVVVAENHFGSARIAELFYFAQCL